MVYDRRIENRELSFEASGALMKASLVMRDRETDSWWSIMTSSGIGGTLDGVDLVELPIGEKSTWKDWVARHPNTRVLSVNGVEHDETDPYARYFTSDKTFRDLQIDDDRLKPKAPIFAFWLDGKPFAAAHERFAGGRLLALGDGRHVYLYRAKGASVFASTRAFEVTSTLIAELGRKQVGLAPVEAAGSRRLEGFDTFWYNWIAVNAQSKLLR